MLTISDLPSCSTKQTLELHRRKSLIFLPFAKYMSAFSAKKINEYLQLLNLYIIWTFKKFQRHAWHDDVDILEDNPTDTSVYLCFLLSFIAWWWPFNLDVVTGNLISNGRCVTMIKCLCLDTWCISAWQNNSGCWIADFIWDWLNFLSAWRKI